MIKKIDISEIEFLKSEALKENLFFNSHTDTYFGYFKNKILVGFCGVMVRGNVAILKNDFVVRNERKQGIYRQLNDYRFNYLKSLGIKHVEGNMTDKSLPLHLKSGAEIIKQYKCCTKVRYENF